MSILNKCQCDGKDNLYKEDSEEEASLILVLQVCAGDMDNMDIKK